MSSTQSSDIDIYSGGPATPAYMAAVCQAAVAGKRIQYAARVAGIRGATFWQDLRDSNLTPSWNWSSYDFRVDPTDKPKKCVPLDISDLGPVTWLRGPDIVGEAMVIDIHVSFVTVSPDCGSPAIISFNRSNDP